MITEKTIKMGDVRTALRSTLSATDGTAPSIQASASAMMRMYDSPSLAVAEWRNVLQTCTDSQLLPLLYVTNEVLQISKRNRGNKYLEAFSPMLNGSLQLICERDPSVTEKVRRTTKIWGDRRIFSTRYVGELLQGLEDYRNGKMLIPVQARNTEKPSFSPQWKREERHTMEVIQQPKSSPNNDIPSDDSIQFDDFQNDSHDNDDDDDPFLNSGPSLLDVNVSVDKQALQRDASRSSLGVKRRRSSLQNDINDGDLKTKQKISPKRKAALTASSMVELVDQLYHLDAESKAISRVLSSITSSDLCKSTDEVNEVGDELIDLHTQMNSMMLDVKKQEKNLWYAAEGKRNIELEFKRYLVWMKAGLHVDKDEIKFCDDLEKKLTLLQLVHADAKKARDTKRINDALQLETAEAAAKEKAEQEERKRSLEKIEKESSMIETKPGMVWNKTLREYQYLDTEESWRD